MQRALHSRRRQRRRRRANERESRWLSLVLCRAPCVRGAAAEAQRRKEETEEGPLGWARVGPGTGMTTCLSHSSQRVTRPLAFIYNSAPRGPARNPTAPTTDQVSSSRARPLTSRERSLARLSAAARLSGPLPRSQPQWSEQGRWLVCFARLPLTDENLAPCGRGARPGYLSSLPRPPNAPVHIARAGDFKVLQGGRGARAGRRRIRWLLNCVSRRPLSPSTRLRPARLAPQHRTKVDHIQRRRGRHWRKRGLRPGRR